jgi:hypothetical protein
VIASGCHFKKLPRTAIIMKFLSIFTLAATLVVGTMAAVPHHQHTAAIMKVRGGAKLGPLDAKLALDLSKAVTTAYVAGSASKFINRQIGGQDTQVSLSASKFWLRHTQITHPHAPLLPVG